jgi:hypothetical protein
LARALESSGVSRLGRIFDVGCVLAFAFVGLSYYRARWNGTRHFAGLDSDAGMLASFVAALEEPAHFAGDSLLHDPKNFDYYATLQVPLARALSRLTGDIGRAFVLPTAPLVFTQLLGFYVLGRVLLRRRGLAVVLAIMTLPVLNVPVLGDYWGTMGYTTPRDWFQALLPYLLAVALRFGAYPGARLGLMFGAGLTMYVHPVSAPAWTVALWLSMLWCLPASLDARRRAVWMAAGAAAWALAALPFVVIYLTKHEHGASADHAETYAIIAYRFLPGLLNVPATAASIAAMLWQDRSIALALLGAIAVFIRAPAERLRLLMVLTWVGALAVTSFGVPILEHRIAAARGAIPLEFDLVRGWRYLPPLLHVLALWGLSVLGRPGWWRSGCALAAASVLAGAYFAANPLPEAVLQGGRALVREKGWAAPAPPSPREQILLWIAERTPPGAAILPVAREDQLAVRYVGRRAVVHSWKEGGILAYSNHAALRDWFLRSVRVEWIAGIPDPSRRFAELLSAAREYRAQYVLLDQAPPAEMIERLGGRQVARRADYALVEVVSR